MNRPRAYTGRTGGGIEQAVRAGLEHIGWTDIVRPGARVLVKPNLTYPRYKEGATTSPEFIDAVLGILRERTPHITVAESDGGNHSYPAEVPFEGHDLPDIVARHDAELFSLSRDEWERVPVKSGLFPRSIPLSKRMLHEFDVTVNLPVPKMHFVVGYTGAVKNHWGLVPDSMRLRNHFFFADAIHEIIRRSSPEIVIADGTFFMDRNGPVRGDPVRMDLTVVADSPGAADAVLTRIMGLDHTKFFYLRHGIDLGMVPRSIGEIELNEDPDRFHVRDFRLERSAMDWFATVGFRSKWMTRIVYDSPLAGPIHSIIRAGRREKKHPPDCHDCDIRPRETAGTGAPFA
jgi:uncharacterized protein (DUF362 family)